MAKWTRLALLAVVLVLLVQGNAVNYQRSRVASSGSSSGSGGGGGGGGRQVIPGSRARRINSRVNASRRPGGGRVRVRGGAGGAAADGQTLPQLPDSYFEEGGGATAAERRRFYWNSRRRTQGLGGGGAAAGGGVVTSSGGRVAPPAGGASPVRQYSSSYYWSSRSAGAGGGGGGGAGAEAGQGAAGVQAGGYGGEPGFAGTAGTNVRRTSVSRHRVTTIGGGGGFPCSEEVPCSTGGQFTAQQAGGQVAGAASQQTGRTYGQTQQTRRIYGAQSYGQTDGSGQTYDRTQSQAYDRYGNTATYDRTHGGGRTYDRTGGRVDTSRGASVVTRYPGRTVFRNATGTYVNYTRTLPDGRTISSYNYTVRYPGRTGGVISARNTTTVRNRTVVTTTSQRVVPGGSRVTYRNTTSVSRFPATSVTGSTVRETILESSRRGSSVTGSSGRGSSVTGSSVTESSGRGSSVTGSSVTESSRRGSSVTGSSGRGSSVTGSSGRGSSLAESSRRGSSVTESSVTESSVTGSTSGSSSSSSSGSSSRFGSGSGSVSGSGSSTRTTVTTRYGNESRTVSPGVEPRFSKSERTGVSVSGGGLGRGRGGSTSSTSSTERVTNRYGVRGSSTSTTTTTRVVEKRISRAELHAAYNAKNRLERFGEATPQQTCERGSCLPASGNLLIGREDRLDASSTCGLRQRERYCIVSHLEERKKCFWCDSRPQTEKKLLLNHQIKYAVGATQIGTKGYRRLTWWQAENGMENVQIQLDLEAEFHFTHLIMKFKTFRPKAMIIERSFDFGKTWHVYRYFADRCLDEFPDVRRGNPRTLSEVICQERYSRVEPSSRGEVIFRALPPRLTPSNPYSDEVQNLLKITNLRVNFTRLHTLGDDLLDNRREIKEKYYYAIYEMVVAGRCSCYGHAPRCLPLPGVDPVPEMVHGRCECIHNTEGLNCERCIDFYNDLPWKPAVGKETNACKRCNCHNHSDRCHFDPTRYNQTGFVSGGVCDDCRHNTEGYNCEQCQTGFFQVPGLDMQDPNICRACECDPRGSLYDGICESKATDTLPAGHCHCKEHVAGARCDRCQAGFWNFTTENPAGCQECTCEPLGSLPDIGCDERTGNCRCKRNVVGRNCDQCPPMFWGLSDHPDGCKPCSCDPGGAYDNTCDVVTGQCKCRPNLAGLTCSEPQENFYGGLLDYLVYDAEIARTDESSQTVVREPYRDGRRTSWTGPGFTRVFENSFIEFDVDNIERSLDYDLVVRYEPQSAAAWDNVRMTLIRDENDPIDPAGQCGTVQPGDDQQRLILPSDRRYVTGYPPLCLEKGKRYKVRLEFEAFADDDPSRNIGTLVDSIALIPRVTELPIFQGSEAAALHKQEFDHYRCAEYFYQVYGSKDMPEACRKHMASIGYYVFEGAKDKECGCDPTGSESTLCDPLGGQCRCKTNVVGRRCDQCAPGTYGFGPEGCTACDCNAVGSLDNFCDRTSGQCKCRPNTYGRSCDECQPGFWNYPDCQRCDCNGHAPTCEPRTGACIDCGDSTAGPHCEVCEETYYGDPRLGVDIPCRPCPCPDTVESGHSFADRCYLDPTTESVLCECRQGHTGTQCDVCADNYYGNPEVPGGSCQPCDCSSNVDPSRPGNCDPSTGECLQCLFNTAGYTCDRCADGFYGDAVERTCQECVCNMLGTDATAGPCDASTGQCNCLANVMGHQCDRCIPNHWKIAIGDGCEPCACDPVGSSDDQCNEYDGKCTCRPGFGGRRCNECQDDHWGNPRVQCFPCECNPYGSEEKQCDRDTGLCPCKEGMGGDKCDQCARGFKGSAPYCDACGECFNNWDRILTELRDRTEYLVQEAGNIKQGGAAGAYQREFQEMENWLEGVRQMLGNATVSDDQVDRLQGVIDQVRTNLTESETMLRTIEAEVDDVTQRVLLAELKVPVLRGRADTLRTMAQLLQDNATVLQEANVDGALALTRQAQRRSEAAEFSVQENERTLASSERQRRRTENLLSRAGQQFNQSQDSNQRLIDDVNQKLSDFERQIPGINEQVCDGEGDPCDSLCGGAGCGKCGGLSCDDGAVTKAANALSVAQDAADILTDREREVDDLLRDVTMAKSAAEEAYSLAQMAFTGAELNHNRTETTKLRVAELLVQIGDFLSEDGASPQAIRDMARETQDMSISLRPEQITDLARQINETIASLTNIQGILDATADDLAAANALKQRADYAKAQAEQILQTAQAVMTALDGASSAQDAARDAMASAETNIEQAEADLTSIASEAGEAQRQANESLVTVDQLRVRQRDLSRQFSRNELDVRNAVKEAAAAGVLADKAQRKVSELETDYAAAIALLQSKEQTSGSARDRARRLLERANNLALRANGQVEELNEMNSEFMLYETRLRDLSDEVMSLNQRMDEYLYTITTRAEKYRTCQS